MPPNPIAPASSVSQTCGLRERAAARGGRSPPGRPGSDGTNAITRATVTSASPATAQYAARQPRLWPSQVAAGTPTTLATERPSITSATARPWRPGGAMLAATSEATPK